MEPETAELLLQRSYEPDDQGIEVPLPAADFSLLYSVQTDSPIHPTSYLAVGKAASGVNLNTHLHQVLSLRLRRVTPLFSHPPSCMCA
jgi:hypothetical protein